MSIVTLAQSDGYSGASHPGLNITGSYHRMVYEDRKKILSLEGSKSIISDMYEQFQSSSQSRLVIRILANISAEEMIDIDNFIHGMNGTFGIYHNYQPDSPQFTYFTISFNRVDRNPENSLVKILTEHNKKYIGTMIDNIGDFESFNLKKLYDFHQKGFSLTREINTQELLSLWGESFGWSELACDNLLRGNDGSFPLGVRSRTQELVAVVLYSNQPHEVSEDNRMVGMIQHGETTEASTLMKYQGNGIMPVLVTGLHAQLISQGIYNVYGELRAEDITGDKPNSINHGTKSGKIFHFHNSSSNILVNHVSIGGNEESYNIDRKIPGYNSSPTGELRSFLIGSMDPNKISHKVVDAYITSTNS